MTSKTLEYCEASNYDFCLQDEIEWFSNRKCSPVNHKTAQEEKKPKLFFPVKKLKVKSCFFKMSF